MDQPELAQHDIYKPLPKMTSFWVEGVGYTLLYGGSGTRLVQLVLISPPRTEVTALLQDSYVKEGICIWINRWINLFDQ